MSVHRTPARRPPPTLDGVSRLLLTASIRIAVVLVGLVGFVALQECGADETKLSKHVSPDGRWIAETGRFGSRGETYVALRASPVTGSSPDRLVLAERALWAAVAWSSPAHLVVYLPVGEGARRSTSLGAATVSFQSVSFDSAALLEKTPEASFSRAKRVRVHFDKRQPRTRHGRLYCELHVDGEADGDLTKFRFTLRTSSGGALASGMRFEAALSADAEARGVRLAAAQASSPSFRSDLGDQRREWNHARSIYDRAIWVNSWIPATEEHALRTIAEGGLMLSYAVVGPMKIEAYRIADAGPQSAIDAYRACATEAFSEKWAAYR